MADDFNPLSLIAAPVSGAFGAYGAKKQADAAKHAADLQSKSAADSLAFQQHQQEIAQQEFEQAQRANYGQWAADERNQFGVSLAAGHNNYAQYKARDQRVGKLGELLGMAPRETPAYEDPTLTIPDYQGPGAPPTQGAPSGNGTNVRDPNFITQQLQGVYKSLGATPTGSGTGPTDIAYMAGKVAQTGGWTPDNAKYWPTRIAQEIAKAKASGGYQSKASALLGAH